jgi:dephospho-CoA kinase
MKIVGLAGGIACGKSSVSSLLREEHGIPVVDADAIAHAVLAPGTFATRSVASAFGPSVLRSDAGSATTIDRQKLGALVFNDRAQRRQLEAIQRPYIALALLRQLLWHWLIGTAVVVLDAPLLFESGLHRLCSQVVCVHLGTALQLERLVARDPRAGDADARARIAAQPLSSDEKARRADVVLANEGSLADLTRRVRLMVPGLRSRSLIQRISGGRALLVAAALLARAPRLASLARRAVGGMWPAKF